MRRIEGALTTGLFTLETPGTRTGNVAVVFLPGPGPGGPGGQKMQCLPGRIGEKTQSQESTVHGATSGGDLRKISPEEQLKLGLKNLETFSLVLHHLPRPDLAALAQLHLTVDFHLPFGDDVLGLAAGGGEVHDLQEIAQRDELRPFEVKFFHPPNVSESLAVRPVNFGADVLFFLRSGVLEVLQIPGLPEVHAGRVKIAVLLLLVIPVVRVAVNDRALPLRVDELIGPGLHQGWALHEGPVQGHGHAIDVGHGGHVEPPLVAVAPDVGAGEEHEELHGLKTRPRERLVGPDVGAVVALASPLVMPVHAKEDRPRLLHAGEIRGKIVLLPFLQYHRRKRRRPRPRLETVEVPLLVELHPNVAPDFQLARKCFLPRFNESHPAILKPHEMRKGGIRGKVDGMDAGGENLGHGGEGKENTKQYQFHHEASSAKNLPHSTQARGSQTDLNFPQALILRKNFEDSRRHCEQNRKVTRSEDETHPTRHLFLFAHGGGHGRSPESHKLKGHRRSGRRHRCHGAGVYPTGQSDQNGTTPEGPERRSGRRDHPSGRSPAPLESGGTGV